MAREKLKESIKTRVDRRVKKQLEALAIKRRLTVSDITRDAVHEFILKHEAETREAVAA